MRLKERTLEDMITLHTEKLSAQKISSDANIAKITERFNNETDVTEKNRLENLIRLHTEHRASLDLIDATEEATKRWNDIQTNNTFSIKQI